MSYGVGDEVVCINDSDPPQGPGPKVVQGQHYTVTAMELKEYPVGMLGPFVVMKPQWFVHLKEVPSPTGIGFFAFRFVKAKKKSTDTDISIFKEIADGTRTAPPAVEPRETTPVKKPEKVE